MELHKNIKVLGNGEARDKQPISRIHRFSQETSLVILNRRKEVGSEGYWVICYKVLFLEKYAPPKVLMNCITFKFLILLQENKLALLSDYSQTIFIIFEKMFLHESYNFILLPCKQVYTWNMKMKNSWTQIL